MTPLDELISLIGIDYAIRQDCGDLTAHFAEHAAPFKTLMKIEPMAETNYLVVRKFIVRRKPSKYPQQGLERPLYMGKFAYLQMHCRLFLAYESKC